jgi:uncharacterized protein (TIGR01244 family)
MDAKQPNFTASSASMLDALNSAPAYPVFMHRIHSIGTVLVLGIAAALTGCGSPPAARPPALAEPVTSGELTATITNLSQSGDTYFAGFPSKAGLRELKARGITRVISLKTNEEVMKAKAFDEAALAKELGIELTVIPVTAKSFSADDVERFRVAYESSNAPVLVHCGASNTAGGMWAAYLARVRGMSQADALAAGRAAGLKSPEMIKATEAVIAAP